MLGIGSPPVSGFFNSETFLMTLARTVSIKLVTTDSQYPAYVFAYVYYDFSNLSEPAKSTSFI